MRIVFAGTPDIALPALRSLAAIDRTTICAVLTMPDRPGGRGRVLQPSPVKWLAASRAIPVLQPERLDAACRAQIAALKPDLLVCFAYGKIFGPKFLALFPRGAINVHPSLLPRYRGPSPIPAVLLSGDVATGVSVQWISDRMDAGDLLFQCPFAIAVDETTETLSERAAQLGARLLVQAVAAIAAGDRPATPQNEDDAVYCRMIDKRDGWIEWALPALFIDRMIRAFGHRPGAMTHFQGQQLKLLAATAVEADALPAAGRSEAAYGRSAASGQAGDFRPGQVVAVDATYGILVQTGSGLLAVLRLQLQGRRPVSWRDFANGYQPQTGTQLG